MNIQTSNLTSLESDIWNNILKQPTVIEDNYNYGINSFLIATSKKIKIDGKNLQCHRVILSQLFGSSDFELKNIFSDLLSKSNPDYSLIIFEDIDYCSKDVFSFIENIFINKTINGNPLPKNAFFTFTVNNFKSTSNLLMPTNSVSHFNKLTFNITLEEWIKVYGEDNINSFIIKFLKENPDMFINIINNNETSKLNTPRNWLFISMFFNSFLENPENSFDNTISLFRAFSKNMLNEETLEKLTSFLQKHLQ